MRGVLGFAVLALARLEFCGWLTCIGLSHQDHYAPHPTIGCLNPANFLAIPLDTEILPTFWPFIMAPDSE
jgi:hypothetical protein